MNKQKIIIGIGAFLLALMAVFPPYNGIILGPGDNFVQFIGYHCIFVPPSIDELADKYSTVMMARIDMSRWLIQFSTCIAIVMGVYFMLTSGKSNKPPFVSHNLNFSDVNAHGGDAVLGEQSGEQSAIRFD